MPRSDQFRAVKSALLLAGLCVPLASAYATPTVSRISLHGLQRGATTTVTIEGSELLPDPVVVLPFPVTRQQLKDGATDQRVEIEISLDEHAAVGIHQLYLVNAHGISNPVAVGVDSLPQRQFASEVSALPVALHGELTGDQTMRTAFDGCKDMAVVVEVEARRLGAALKPVVRLLDERGTQLAWGSSRQRLGGDARCEAVLPADGRYTVVIHDVLYRGAAPGFFRLKVGQLHYADLAFPLGVERGTKSSLAFASSNLPPDTRVVLDQDLAVAPYRVSVTLPPDPALTGPQPAVFVSGYPEVVEEPPADGQLQSVSQVPVAVNGRISAPGEEDRYRLAVTAGSKIRLDVQAHRAGSPLDGVLAIHNDQGSQLAASDDQPGTPDPGLELTVPENVDHVVVSLRDLLKRGGDAFIYRIVVTETGQPDFRLLLDADRVTVPAGGTQVVSLRVERSGYAGPIQLVATGLPEGVQFDGGVIPAGRMLGLMTFSSSSGAAHGLLTVMGSSHAVEPPLHRLALASETAAAEQQPALRNQLAFAVAEAAPITIAWAESDSPGKALLGGKVSSSVRVARRDGTQGTVRLRLLTDQVMPKKKVKKDNQEQEVDDVERALRFEGSPMIAADATEAGVSILIPPDLSKGSWTIAVVGELLGPDNKTVLATAATALRSLVPESPMTLELAGVDKIEGKAGLGETGALVGKIVRAEGFSQPVTVTLSGLPEGYVPPKVVVPADQSEFSLTLQFPYGTKTGELKDARLVATFQPLAENAELLVRSNEVAVGVINVVQGEKPPAGPARAIFEDDAKFISYLTKGGGQISLDENDKFTGSASIKVTPDQRFNETVPDLSLNIREKPGPGEYRYLRFAWKKQGGSTICLQLNHDGTWGPGGSGKEGAKFRYHAGPGGECYGASLALDENLPAEFVVVTRDLFEDFGEFTLTGIALSPVDGEFALFDHLYLGQTVADLDAIKP